ncbi:hypothetical protein SDC9_154031 [bioreactor metagenome]|uniref:Uncharacterized protein n=1 Tax=bioreactor metagenome TaxID=1076179 RepID=A0A645F2G4_9ZZZZ
MGRDRRPHHREDQQGDPVRHDDAGDHQHRPQEYQGVCLRPPGYPFSFPVILYILAEIAVAGDPAVHPGTAGAEAQRRNYDEWGGGEYRKRDPDAPYHHSDGPCCHQRRAFRPVHTELVALMRSAWLSLDRRMTSSMFRDMALAMRCP